MPALDFTDDEHAAVVAALRKLIADDKFPLSPRPKPLKSALAKMDLKPPKKPLPPPPQPGDGPRYGKGGSAKRQRRNPLASGWCAPARISTLVAESRVYRLPQEQYPT